MDSGALSPQTKSKPLKFHQFFTPDKDLEVGSFGNSGPASCWALTPRTAPFSVLILHTMHRYKTKIATNTNKEKEIKSAYGLPLEIS